MIITAEKRMITTTENTGYVPLGCFHNRKGICMTNVECSL
jgi:hypothetical protein